MLIISQNYGKQYLNFVSHTAAQFVVSILRIIFIIFWIKTCDPYLDQFSHISLENMLNLFCHASCENETKLLAFANGTKKGFPSSLEFKVCIQVCLMESTLALRTLEIWYLLSLARQSGSAVISHCITIKLKNQRKLG